MNEYDAAGYCELLEALIAHYPLTFEGVPLIDYYPEGDYYHLQIESTHPSQDPLLHWLNLLTSDPIEA